jgi:uncharacterized membrane protein YvbJ
MAVQKCSKCGHEMPDQTWGCPQCRTPATTGKERKGAEISGKGMMILIALFILFPILLFLVHIFVPGM